MSVKHNLFCIIFLIHYKFNNPIWPINELINSSHFSIIISLNLSIQSYRTYFPCKKSRNEIQNPKSWKLNFVIDIWNWSLFVCCLWSLACYVSRKKHFYSINRNQIIFQLPGIITYILDVNQFRIFILYTIGLCR